VSRRANNSSVAGWKMFASRERPSPHQKHMALSCNKGEKELEDISFAEAQNLLMIVGGGSQSSIARQDNGPVR